MHLAPDLRVIHVYSPSLHIVNGDLSGFRYLTGLVISSDVYISDLRLPPSLHMLELTGMFNQRLPDGLLQHSGLRVLKVDGEAVLDLIDADLPVNLTKLIVGNHYSPRVTDFRVRLPKHLKTLVIGAEITFSSTLEFPPTLSLLFVKSRSFNMTGPVMLPESLKTLRLRMFFGRIEQFVLPAGLRELEMGFGFNFPLDDVKFPESLEHLDLGTWFNFPIDRVDFPKGLKTLILGHHYTPSLSQATFPAGLKMLCVDNHTVYGKDLIEWIRHRYG